ncbi:MAG: acyl-CoA dehydrogenase family protein [Raoultibacter sp.]
MDFSLNDDQELFVSSIRDLMERENWESYFAECDATHTYPERWTHALCELGFDLIMLPEARGGLDLGVVTLMAAYEELGRLGAPTYVLYQLPGFETICERAAPSRSKRSWRMSVPVNKFGIPRVPNRELVPTWAV